MPLNLYCHPLFCNLLFHQCNLLKKIIILLEKKKLLQKLLGFFVLPTQNVDKWSFDVFALNEASGDHALKFIFYELLTRYDLISRFKVKSCNIKSLLFFCLSHWCKQKLKISNVWLDWSENSCCISKMVILWGGWTCFISSDTHEANFPQCLITEDT